VTTPETDFEVAARIAHVEPLVGLDKKIQPAHTTSSSLTCRMILSHQTDLQPPLRFEAVAPHAKEQEADCNHAAIMF
jgi:hypothetical protein